MKVYKNDNKTVLYGFADPEGAAERRKHRSSVIPDKKKDTKKNQCRNAKNRKGMDE